MQLTLVPSRLHELHESKFGSFHVWNLSIRNFHFFLSSCVQGHSGRGTSISARRTSLWSTTFSPVGAAFRDVRTDRSGTGSPPAVAPGYVGIGLVGCLSLTLAAQRAISCASASAWLGLLLPARGSVCCACRMVHMITVLWLVPRRQLLPLSSVDSWSSRSQSGNNHITPCGIYGTEVCRLQGHRRRGGGGGRTFGVLTPALFKKPGRSTSQIRE